MAGFKKATKAAAKLRAALFGPSGAGKTFSSLRIATGLADGKPIAFIDTERGSASKYSDHFDFDVLELDDKSIEGYVEAINMAAAEGYEVLIIDSLSHAWQQLLEEIDKLAKAKYRGNTWSAWSEGTPLQRRLVDAILGFPGHVLATMRSKTEWQTSSDGGGKTRPVRVGLAPEQGKGVEYEFDLLLEISTEHIANVIKDRTGKFQDKLIDKPGEMFGNMLREWLSDGEAKPAQPAKKAAAKKAKPDATPPMADDAAMEKARLAILAAQTEAELKRFTLAVHTRQDQGFYTSEQAQQLLDMLDDQADAMKSGKA